MPAITVNNYGKGKAYYIGARIDRDALYEIYSRITSDCGVEQLLSDIPNGVSVKSRTDGENEYLFIMNFTDEKQKINLGGSFTDMLTGKAFDGFAELDVYGIIIVKRPM